MTMDRFNKIDKSIERMMAIYKFDHNPDEFIKLELFLKKMHKLKNRKEEQFSHVIGYDKIVVKEFIPFSNTEFLLEYFKFNEIGRYTCKININLKDYEMDKFNKFDNKMLDDLTEYYMEDQF